MAQPQYPTQPVDTDGIPPGIPYIIGNEAAERFCFYGMRTILIFARRVKSKFLSITRHRNLDDFSGWNAQ